MAVRRRTQIKVSIKWEARAFGQYAILRWREPNGAGRPTEPLGYVTPEEAEERRTTLEAELRLGRAPKLSEHSFSGYTVAVSVCDFVAAIDTSPTSDAHKRRTAGDCEALGRLLGPYLIESLTPHHVQRFIALRSKERVVRARRLKNEADEAWEKRKTASRSDPNGKPLASTTIKDELATLRRMVTWGRNAGKHKAPDLPPPHRNAMPDDARPARRLLESEARRILAAATRPGEDSLLEVGAWSGRRPIALFHARLGDCSRVLDETLPRRERMMFWRRDKGGQRTGWGRLSDAAYDAIRRRCAELAGSAPDTLLWTQDNGGPWTSSSWPNRFAAIALAGGVENVTFYDLRKHACAQLLRALGNAYEAIEYSGHKTVETFMRNYAYAIGDEPGSEGKTPRIGWSPAPLALVPNGAQNGARGEDKG